MALFKVKVARITYDEIAVSASSEKDAAEYLANNREWASGNSDRVERILKVTHPSECNSEWLDWDDCTFCWSSSGEQTVIDAFFDERPSIVYSAIDQYVNQLELSGIDVNGFVDDLFDTLYFDAYEMAKSEFLAQAKGGE